MLIASQHGDVEIVSELLKNVANVNLKHNTKLSPLHIASQNGHLEVIKLLLAAGADSAAKYRVFTASEIASKGKYNDITKEIKFFDSSPEHYVLKHNNNASMALIAIKNLAKHFHINNLEIIQNCLEAQPHGMLLELNDLCGVNDVYYSDEL